MSKINIAVIGCGRIAQAHLEACQHVKETNLIAIADVNSVAAESVANQFDCKPYTFYREMIDQEQLDAVIVCTPPVSHAEITLHALSQGLHVMCEKPFATNVSDAIKMVKMAEQQERLLMMASKFRFVEDVRKAKEIIESGMLGEIVLYENVFCSYVDMTNRWNSNKEVSGGGVLIDNAPHSVDIISVILLFVCRRLNRRHTCKIR